MAMEMDEYQKLAMRTDAITQYSGYPDKNAVTIQRLLNALMGLNGEAGEAIEILKKAIFQGHQLKAIDILEELGDCLWYIVLGLDALGYSLEGCAALNIDKLRRRYPEGFTTEDSIERRDHDQNGQPDMPEMRDES